MEFYTPEEIAKVLKVHKNTIYDYIKRGELKALKIGKFYRISKEDFEKFLHKDTKQQKGRKPSLKFPL